MRPRVLYISIFAWLVFSGGRFTAPFLENLAHFSDTLNGVTLALQTALGIAVAPYAGLIADSFEQKCPRSHWGRVAVINIGIGIATIALIFHGLLHTLISCTGGEITWVILSCHIIIQIMYALGVAVVIPVLDAMTLVFLREEGKGSNEYGKERLYGAIGWAGASLTVAPFIDRWGYGVMLVFAAISAIVCIMIMYWYTKALGNSIREEHTYEEIKAVVSTVQTTTNSNPSSPSEDGQSESLHLEYFFSLLQLMCGTNYGAGFILSSLTLSMGMSIVEKLLFLFFEELGASASMCGVTVVVTVLFELPIFHVAPNLLEQLGEKKLHQIACFAYISRVVGYTFIPNNHAALVLFLEPLHGITYACQQTCSVAFVAELTPQGFEATGQGVLNGINGFGSVVGLVVGGWLQDKLGPKVMYRCFAAIVAMGLGTFWLMGSSAHRELSKKYQPTTATRKVEAYIKDSENQQLLG